MAIFDNIGGLLGDLSDYGFGVPKNTGLISDTADIDAINRRALMSGLINAGLTYAATPKNLNAGSPLPYLGRAALAGYNTSQDVVDRALNTAYRNKMLTGREDNIRTIKQDRFEITQERQPDGSYKEIARSPLDAPKETKETPLEIDKLIATRDRLIADNPNNPNIAIYDDLIQNLRVKKEGLNINLNQPIPVINPRTGKAELVQFPNKPGEKPLFTGLEKAEPEARLKPVPAGPATAFVENNTAIKKIDDAIAKVEAAPENTFGIKNYLGGVITQRIDPKGTAARAAVAGVGGQKYHDLSGAAVAVQEAARLAPYIPQTTDTKEKVLENLRNLKREYTYTNDTLTSTFNEDQGYRPLNIKPTTTPSSENKKQSITTNVQPTAQPNRAYIGNRAIIVKGNKWVYEDTGEVAQ